MPRTVAKSSTPCAAARLAFVNGLGLKAKQIQKGEQLKFKQLPTEDTSDAYIEIAPNCISRLV